MIRAAAALLASAALLLAGITGSISGTLKDPSGAVIPRVMLTLTNALQGIHFQAMTDQNGVYTFPSLPVGRYDLKIEASGFMPYERNGLVVDANSSIKLDLTMEMGERLDTVTVSESANHLETESTQMGDVVSSTRMTSVALNGRSFTDLLALQPGIVPMTTQQPESIVMAGASVAIAPSGVLNPGNQSIGGQREDANGFMVNGGDVKELMNGGTTIVPNLDSIAEFRILTNNFDAEYGNYSGGVINVVTKSGSNAAARQRLRVPAKHRSGRAQFLFSRAQLLSTKPVRRNARRAHLKKNKLFFFGDYQGTRQSQGIDTGLDSRAVAGRPDGESQRHCSIAHRLGGRSVFGESSLSETRLWRDGERALLHAGLRRVHAMRLSKCHHSTAGLVRAGPTSAAIHSAAQRGRLHFFDRLGWQNSAGR